MMAFHARTAKVFPFLTPFLFLVQMNGKLIKCERETRNWKSKSEESNQALILASDAKFQLEKKLNLQVKKQEQLEKLTRALQEERNSLTKELTLQRMYIVHYTVEDESPNLYSHW